jgi:acyl carrier protein
MELNSDYQIVCDAVARLTAREVAREDIRAEMLLSRDLGIDSLQFIRLILEIESQTARRIFDVQVISQIKTVQDLCNVVARR